jgi:hypothetical protein
MKINKECQPNQILLMRTAQLGKVAMSLVVERMANSYKEEMNVWGMFLYFLKLENLRNCLREDWLTCNSLSSELETYLTSIQIDIDDMDAEINNKTLSSHMFAVAPLRHTYYKLGSIA